MQTLFQVGEIIEGQGTNDMKKIYQRDYDLNTLAERIKNGE